MNLAHYSPGSRTNYSTDKIDQNPYQIILTQYPEDKSWSLRDVVILQNSQIICNNFPRIM